jgi:hypothetical protein
MLDELTLFHTLAAALIWLIIAGRLSPEYILEGPLLETKNGTVLLDSVVKSNRATIAL